ncbi:polyphosphate kinase [Rhodocytophaga rosea]|uniref:Polyphosphate kinase n=1 Tax=Rhodocytophaga rosea TaxID=2704465 RepID=A0A6C0GKL8_9BACT|nr:PPK2 family polyphosphate kinase [Rhodocytophaga rosea]QHT68497.1 polyphosphate kinase [Rhodocytophaga rosea]
MKLSHLPTRAPEDLDKEKTKDQTLTLLSYLQEKQDILYAQQQYSLLIVLQGLDASGKDGLVKKVFSGVNPMGCQVKAFKAPTEEELSHDFLWRIHKYTPAKGMIQIFNRSHYEDVLVPRVEGWVKPAVIKRSYGYINSFEQLLQDSNTLILKFFLNVSEDKQRERIQERITDPNKHWKYDPGDMLVVKKRDDYLEAYQDVVEECSPDIPWTIVPADQNWYKEYVVAKKIVDTLDTLDLRYPDKLKK